MYKNAYLDVFLSVSIQVINDFSFKLLVCRNSQLNNKMPKFLVWDYSIAVFVEKVVNLAGLKHFLNKD
jgi:hypothetical protein